MPVLLTLLKKATLLRLFAIAACLCPTLATADITARFIESAPKDRFEITNTGCDLDSLDLTINLATAPAGLIFDVSASGAGVEVFQPVEVVSGRVALSDVTDGDQALALRVTAFGTGETIVISADLDDLQVSSQLGQIRVSGAEIAGATLVVGDSAAAFGPDATARLPMPACLG